VYHDKGRARKAVKEIIEHLRAEAGLIQLARPTNVRRFLCAPDVNFTNGPCTSLRCKSGRDEQRRSYFDRFNAEKSSSIHAMERDEEEESRESLFRGKPRSKLCERANDNDDRSTIIQR